MSNEQDEQATFVEGGEYMGLPCDAKYRTNKDGSPHLSLSMVVVNGPLKGMKAKYDFKKWDQKSMKYGIPHLKAAGWQGKDPTTFEADILAAFKVGKPIQFKARLAEYNGSTWWTAGSIGIFVPALAPPTKEATDNAKKWLAEYEAGAGSDEPAPF